MASSNPWTDNRLACIRLGSVEDIRRIAAQQGYEKPTLTQQEDGATWSHSLQLISRLQELTGLHGELDAVGSRLFVMSDQLSTADLTDSRKAENWLEEVKGLSDHLCRLLNDKQRLVSLLSQPLVGQHIAIDAKYHRSLTAIYPQLMSYLASLSEHLNSLHWAAETLDEQSSAARTAVSSQRTVAADPHSQFPDLSRVTQSLTSLQQQFRRLDECRHAMTKLLDSSGE